MFYKALAGERRPEVQLLSGIVGQEWTVLTY